LISLNDLAEKCADPSYLYLGSVWHDLSLASLCLVSDAFILQSLFNLFSYKSCNCII